MRKRSTKSWSCNPAWSALLVRARRKMRFAPAAGMDMLETNHRILIAASGVVHLYNMTERLPNEGHGQLEIKCEHYATTARH